MIRNKWEFEYTGSQLAVAAKKKCQHRLDRLSRWEEQKAQVMAEVRKSGIEVSESVGAAYANKTSGYAPEVMVRTDLQKKLSECHIKIMEHSAAAREYDGWRQVMSASPNARVPLNHDDWLYFFGEDKDLRE